MDTMTRLVNSFLFWAAWIIIPLILEILPAIGSIFILIKRRIETNNTPKPIMYPDITIIIPIYNSEDTLEECLKSINDSDYPNDRIRIFLVNNHCKDDSFNVFTRCQNIYTDLHMQWLNAEQGKSRALNLALYNSKGKYIINIDSDGALEKTALTHMVDRFEANPDYNCMTGVIMIKYDKIRNTKNRFLRFLQKLEFMEYGQAFLAGRNYASETNSIYTLSGAFSGFRKSAILKSRLYNTDTIAEDTQLTFQMRYLQNEKIHLSEKSVYVTDPIESIDKLYTQRQRWQRGSLEVSKMFIQKKLKARKVFSDVNVKTLLFDHTFAFPRMIWYLALFCLLFTGYSGRTVAFASMFLFSLYFFCGFLYFFSAIGFLKDYPGMKKAYIRSWYLVVILPFYNLLTFFFRFAGIINSINTVSSWKTRTLSEEAETASDIILNDTVVLRRDTRLLHSIFDSGEERAISLENLDNQTKENSTKKVLVTICCTLTVLISLAGMTYISMNHHIEGRFGTFIDILIKDLFS